MRVKKLKIQSCITQFLKNNKKWVLSDSMLKKYRLFVFPKSSSSQNKQIYVWEKRVCSYHVKFAFYGFAYYGDYE